MKRIALLLALIFVCSGTVPHVKAYYESAAHLTITPRLCVVDTVQDGSNQTMRLSSPGCEDALPDLTAMGDQPLKDLPVTFLFAAGAHTTPVLQPKTANPPSIIVKEPDRLPPGPSPKKSYLTLALMATAFVCVIGTSVVLYRIRYPKAARRLQK